MARGKLGQKVESRAAWVPVHNTEVERERLLREMTEGVGEADLSQPVPLVLARDYGLTRSGRVGNAAAHLIHA